MKHLEFMLRTLASIPDKFIELDEKAEAEEVALHTGTEPFVANILGSASRYLTDSLTFYDVLDASKDFWLKVSLETAPYASSRLTSGINHSVTVTLSDTEILDSVNPAATFAHQFFTAYTILINEEVDSFFMALHAAARNGMEPKYYEAAHNVAASLGDRAHAAYASFKTNQNLVQRPVLLLPQHTRALSLTELAFLNVLKLESSANYSLGNCLWVEQPPRESTMAYILTSRVPRLRRLEVDVRKKPGRIEIRIEAVSHYQMVPANIASFKI